MMRPGSTLQKKNCPVVAAWTLSARRELQSHPLAGQAQASGRFTEGGWMEGPIVTLVFSLLKKPFSRVIVVLGTMLIFEYRSTEDPRIVRVILTPEPRNFHRIEKKKKKKVMPDLSTNAYILIVDDE